MPVAEYFSERRMATCIKAFQQMYAAGPSHIIIFTDEPVDGKSIEELSKMYFEIVTPDSQVSLPFLDMLVSFKMVVKYSRKQKHEPQEETAFTIKTIFQDDEVDTLFNVIKRRVGFKVKSEIL